MIKFNITIILMMLLSSCGFHLRGKIYIPQELYNLNLETSENLENSIFTTKLKDKFSEYKINVYINNKNDKLYTLKITDEKFNKETFTTNSSSVINQYKLTYSIKFELLNPKDEVLNHSQVITITRTFASDPNTILDNDNEERVLKEEMQQQAIREILKKISRITKITVYNEQQ